MTEIKITKKNEKIAKVVASGHTGYSKHGEDIVCAAISSIVQTAALGLLTVAQIDIGLKRDEEKGRLEMSIPAQMSDLQQVRTDTILDTMMLGLYDLFENYSDFIAIETENV